MTYEIVLMYGNVESVTFHAQFKDYAHASHWHRVDITIIAWDEVSVWKTKDERAISPANDN